MWGATYHFLATLLENLYFNPRTHVGCDVIICLNYSLSILENVGVMGVYVPKFLKSKIQAELKRYEDKLEGDKEK